MNEAEHSMTCPIDGTTLVMSERSGIEIDYCPTCRGVWLDRGELDKIIERNAQSMSPTPSPRPAPSPGSDNRRGYSSDGRHGRKRKKSFLEELFD